MKLKLLTKWENKELICCCPLKGQCLKNHGCEEMEFHWDPYANPEQCMNHESYARVKGSIQQRR
jgi:hypothetical protein